MLDRETSGSSTRFISSGLACSRETIWVTILSSDGVTPSGSALVARLFSLAICAGTILITSPDGTVVNPLTSRTDSKTL